MAIYSDSRTTLRQELAKMVQDYLAGVADATTSTSSIVDADLTGYNNDHFNGWEVFAPDVTTPVASQVTDFVKSSGTLSIAPAITGMTSGKAWELHDPTNKFRVHEYHTAINRAIDALSRLILIDKVDETLSLVASTYEYNIPSGFLAIDSIYMETSTASLFEARPIDSWLWKVVNKATPVIVFNRDHWSPTASRDLRLIGQAKQATLSAESSTCALPTHFVLALARGELHAAKGQLAEYRTLHNDTLSEVMSGGWHTPIRPGSQVIRV